MGGAVKVVAAIAGYAIAGPAGGLFGSALLGQAAGFVVSSAINQIGGRAFAKKPKGQAFTAEASGRAVAIRSPVESHKIIYGTARVSGPLVYVSTTDSGPNPAGEARANKMLHMVIALAGHEVEEIGDIYINDRIVQFASDGRATTAPYQVTTQPQEYRRGVIFTSFSATAVAMTTDTPHGFAPGDTVTIGPQPVSIANGVYTIATTPSANTFTFAYSTPAHLIGYSTGTTTVAKVTKSTTSSYAYVYKYLGSPNQAASGPAQANIPGWTGNHRLRGIAYLYVRLEFNNDVFPLGIPNISAVVKGKKVYDPRTGLTAWSDNPALCIRDYMASDYGFACASDEINDTYFAAAANVCDEDVALSTGGTQNRYSCNGVVDTASAPLDNLGSLVTSLAGAVTYVQGEFRLHAGAYDEPAGAITTDHLAAPIRAVLRTDRKKLFNAVKGVYVDPAQEWQPTDFPFVTNSTYEAQDGGEQIFTDLDLPFTTNPHAAQRIAKLILEKARQGIVIELALNHSATQYTVYDTVTFTNAAPGWGGKVFRIISAATDGIGPVMLALQEESSASYAWNNGEATVIDPAPDTNLPDPFTVLPPGTLTVTETLYVTRVGNGVKARANLSWLPSNDAFGREYQVEYRASDAINWTVLPPTRDTEYTLDDVGNGTYEFRVKTLSILGGSSTYSSATKQLVGLTAPPARVANLSLNVINGAAHLSWDQATDLDVLNGGSVRVRYSASATTATWNSSIDIGPALPGTTTSAVLPLLAGTYLVKFVDSSGTSSENASTVATNVVNLIEMNVVETINEHPAFTGDKSFVGYDESASGIKLTGSALWDDYPGDIDDWSELDTLGGIAANGVYSFANSIDLGAVYTCKVTAAIRADGFGVDELFDSRTALMDSWPSFDGGEINDFTDGGIFYTLGQDATVTGNVALAPDNTLTADYIQEGTDINGWHLVTFQNSAFGVKAEQPVTAELYVKPNGRNVLLEMRWLQGAFLKMRFDLTDGSLNSSSKNEYLGVPINIADYGITEAANGYYRIWVTADMPTINFDDGFRGVNITLLDGSFNEFYTGDGVSGVYPWGFNYYAGSLKPPSNTDAANMALDIRTTNDDPSGSPVWSDWRQFYVGDYTARGFEFQSRLSTTDPSTNILVTELGVTIDMPDRVASGTQIISGAGIYSVTYANAFRVTPAIAITAYNMATGDYYEVDNEDATGFDITFRNSAGTAISRRFDYTAKGYGKLIT